MESKSNIYKTTIDGQNIILDANFLHEYISRGQYLEILSGEDIETFGLSKDIFAKALLRFIKNKSPEVNYLYKSSEFGDEAFKTLTKAMILNYFKINSPHQSNDYFSNRISLNPELRKSVVNNIPENLNKEELAYYIYHKLCYLFKYDEEFDAAGQRGKIAKIHEDYKRINSLTPENNSIVCYEFIYVYAQFLREMGIDYLINTKNPTEYGKRHTSLTMKLNNCTILVDPTQTIFKDDQYYAKINAPLQGFRCLDNGKQQKAKVKELVNRVGNIYRSREKSKYCPNNDQQYWLEQLKLMLSSNTLPLDQKFELLENSLNTISLPHSEKMALANAFVINLFYSEGTRGQMAISYFCQNLPNKKKLPVLGIAYNKSKDGVTDPYRYMNNKYLVYDGNKLSFFNKNELQTLFDKKTYNYISKSTNDPMITLTSYDQHLPGIFEYDLLDQLD